MKKLEHGRSMVEMLGVLAIIGVLSVGAIAGYSKAMMKYRLNKQAQQLSQILNVLYRHKASWGTNPPSMKLMPYFKKLGEIPKEMIKDETVYIYDSFNGRISMSTNGCPDGENCRGVIMIYTPAESSNIEICQNIFAVAKSFHHNLHYAGAIKTTQDNPEYQFDRNLYGDKYCNGGNCIRNMSLNDIYNKCQFMNDRGNVGYYLFEFIIND